MINPITFLDYDKISDDLYYLGNSTLLRFNVQLAKKGDDGRRHHFHKEYEYNSKYIDKNSVASIKRSFDFYLSIERIDKNKEVIMIKVHDILYMRDQVTQIMNWFRNNNIFGYKKDRLVLLGQPDPINIVNLTFDKWLRFEPIIINSNNQYTCGVRMYLSSDNNFVDIEVDKFMGFAYLISSVNMYESAQLLINYLQRPEFGTNLYTFDFENDNKDTSLLEGVSGKNRTILSQKKSFFQ